jgi:VanZ family protein
MPQDDIPDLDLFWWMTWVKPDKLVHAVLFGMQFMLVMIPIAYQSANNNIRSISLYCAGAVVVWGLSTEIIQRFVPGRSFDWADWIADILGIAIAYWSRPLLFKILLKKNGLN